VPTFKLGPAPDFAPVDESVPGGYLCFIDPSPQLPSRLVVNHILNHFIKNEDAETLNVLLIREKLSKLSKNANNLDKSI